jgi:hypothetical protein
MVQAYMEESTNRDFHFGFRPTRNLHLQLGIKRDLKRLVFHFTHVVWASKEVSSRSNPHKYR